ncbi:flavin-containing monooxygenase [Brachybacterium squillarum]|uniref:flavin-containing monooxygenase n=1 Tax=Brachybacterium squillarum TaxID=661979 RepID=UPI00026293B9|nr:NAD(P)-binding domain-containing protein [Brachybacterium squillarum]
MSELNDQVPTREKVLVIGAGPAGLAAAAALQALEVPFDLVDRAPHVGGIWDPEREDSPVWPSLEMVSSREYTQYEDLLWPVSFPDFLDPAQMAKYLRAYASRHDLGERFRPGVAVRSARPFEEGVWQVEFSTGEITVYGGVISAHGIAERPHRPEWAEQIGEGTRVIHSSEWEGPDGLEGQRVLVVGSGQSAADVAVDAARRALDVRWSMRTGHWVVPRTIAGTPGDVAAAHEPALLGPLNEKIAELVVGRAVGDPAEVGLPTPANGLLEDAVIVSDTVLDRVREGRIGPVGAVVGVEDGRPVLADGVDFAPDLIVLATGYETGADHLPEEVLPRTANGDLDLFLGAFPRGRDDLVVLGQQHVTGGVLPVLVEQADLAAYVMRARREGSPALERFRRLRAGSDRAVSTTPPGGLRGRIAAVLGTASRPPRQATSSGERLVPHVDRDALLARLRSVRGEFDGS